MFEQLLLAAIVIVVAYLFLEYAKAPALLKQIAYSVLFLIVFFFVIAQVTKVMGVQLP